MSEYISFYSKKEFEIYKSLFESEDAKYVNMYITGIKTFDNNVIDIIFDLINKQNIFLKEIKDKYGHIK